MCRQPPDRPHTLDRLNLWQRAFPPRGLPGCLEPNNITRHVVEAILINPASPWGLDDWASEARTSVRTLSCHSRPRREWFGDYPYGVWLRAARTVHIGTALGKAAYGEGREVFMTLEVTGAISFANTLSLSFALDNLVSELALAVDGDPSTPVLGTVAVGAAPSQ